MLKTTLVLMTMMVAMFATIHSHADMTWTGSVKLSPPPVPNPEQILYYLDGCHGDSTDALFTAYIDVRAYEGKTLRFTSIGDTAVWRLQQNPRCSIEPVGPTMPTSSTLEWQSSGENLSIQLAGSALGGGAQASLEYRYTLQVCPCGS
jgi:hypothetical protein